MLDLHCAEHEGEIEREEQKRVIKERKEERKREKNNVTESKTRLIFSIVYDCLL